MKLGRVLTATMALAGALVATESAAVSAWKVPGHFPTIQAAIDSSHVHDGDIIDVYFRHRLAGATVTKAVTIRAVGPVTISSGPYVNSLGKAGFLFPGGGQGSGATITGFSFRGVAFPVFSRGADDVSVSHNTMWAPIQGVTSWANGHWGTGWHIAYNAIWNLRTRCGGGIGILIGDFAGGRVTGNMVAHNAIRGLVHVPPTDCGGYDAPGVVLFADHRYPGDTGGVIEGNRVLKNRVDLVSTRPALVGATGVELTDTRDLAAELDIRDNGVVYNDLRGTPVPLHLTPDELSTVNTIEGNLTGPTGVPDAPSRSAQPSASGALPVR
jgi:hypothetical protein